MKIVNKKVNDLIPYINNPRKNDNAVDKVAASIKEFGFKVPIVIDKENVIVTGHTRLKAANKLGIDTVPCVVADDLSEAQIKAFRIADNRVSEEAEWDFELLEVELESLAELDFNIDEIGFDEKEIKEIMRDEKEVIEDDFDEEPPENPVSKRGDIWLLGRHRLMCGDSTSDDVDVLMDGQKADMLLTDPPYNVSYEGKTKEALKIKNDEMECEEFRLFLKNAFEKADEWLKNGAVFYVWHADSEGYNFRGACKDVGWKVRQCLIWNKSSLVMGRQDYHWKHEPCLYGWKEGASHLWASDRKQTTVLNFERPSRSAEHPTMKPIALFDYQIQNNTKGEDVVLDLFLGSGTTILACEQNGRKAYGLELDEKYVDVIVKRYANFKESTEDIKLLRDGKEYKYDEIFKEETV
jgi:site-specific DNA-methyltransferase (adenine-specific)